MFSRDSAFNVCRSLLATMLVRHSTVLAFVLLSVSWARADLSTIPGVPTFDANVAVSNWNQFVTNLDRAQEFLLHIWKGAYGGVGILWLIWSWWLVLGGFYYSFANTYLGAKDAAEAELKENEVETRARFINQIDVNSLFSNLKSLHDKATSRLGEACYQRGVCEMRSYFATTSFFKMIPKTLRRMLRLEPQNRADGTCGDLYASCSFQNLLLSLLQGSFPGASG